jgi:predicted enzyme related to lactoylglutathione lyase
MSSTTTNGLTFAALSFDCADPAALAEFWGQFLGSPVSQGAVPGDMAVEATGPTSGPRLLFHGMSEAVKAATGSRPVVVTEHYNEEIERVTGLGAAKVTENTLPAVRWTTFADPEGNHFDLVTWLSE